MGKFESKCPLCYDKLPNPHDLLTPYDEELNYFMWMPGFEWRQKVQAIDDGEASGSKKKTRREKVVRTRLVPRKRGPDEPPLAEGEEEEMVEEEYEDYTDVEITDDEDEEEYDDEDMQEAKEEIIEYNVKKEKFDEKASGGRMSTKEATVLARQFGLSPSYRDVEKFEEKNGDSVDFKEFSSQFQESFTHPEDKFENFKSIFAYFDSNSSGILSHQQMKNILCTFGEPLSDAEYKAISAKFFTNPSGINYEEFCRALLVVEVAV